MEEVNKTEKRVADLRNEIQPIIDYTTSVEIKNDEALADAGEMLKKIQVRKRGLEDELATIVRPISASLKLIREKWNDPISALDRAATALKKGIKTYHQQLEDQRKEAQRKLEEQAQKERDRIAEQERKAREKAEAQVAEKKVRLEAAMAEQVEATGAGDHERAHELGKEIAKLEADVGKIETRVEQKTEQLQERAAMVVAPVLQTAAPRVAGVALRSVWKAQVEDLDALIKAAASGDTLARSCLMADTKVLGQHAKSLKENFKVPGVNVWEDKTVAA